MSRASSAVAAALMLLAALAPRPVIAQGQGGSPALLRAMDLEQRGQDREAAAAYRDALREPRDMVAALLGLERAWAAVGQSDSVVAIADSLARAHPSEELVQVVRLRSALYARKPAVANAAFADWTRAVPNQLLPYREYAGLLLETGRLAGADSVVAAAAKLPGAAQGLAGERARIEGARGEWSAAARDWRLAVESGPHLVGAAAFALGEAGEGNHDAIRAPLLAPPVSASSRQLLAELQLAWGSPSDAWQTLSALFPDSTAASVWTSFAERAEGVGAWAPARDAWRAVREVSCKGDATLRAADAALHAGDSRGALAVLDDGRCPPRTPDAVRVAGALRVRALANAGRATEATNALASLTLGDDERRILVRDVAWAWVRTGDIGKARALMGDALDEDTTGVRGWLALYDGDLATARTALRESGTPSTDAVRALAILARARAERSPTLGAAFLALARGDSVTAATQMEAASSELGDAAPALLAAAADLRAAHGDVPGAIALWERILAKWEQSPDAPAAELALARALVARGDAAGAKARAEHLILTYPNSALVPQARRVLDTLSSGD